MWSGTRVPILLWLKKRYQALQHRSALRMFPSGVTPDTRQWPVARMRTRREGLRVVADIPGLLDMVELPGGTFWMGSTEDEAQAYDDEKPRHEITVSGFAIGRVVVTRRLYRTVMIERPEHWARDQDDDLLPAYDVSWFDAITFCNLLSTRQGLTPCYQLEGDHVSWQRDAAGYRLPTEAEWEYAARAGTITRWFCGDMPMTLEEYAWYGEGVRGRVHAVGKKAPNPWGLSDMAGNVYEWCWDWYAPYATDTVKDPMGADWGVSRVVRGGAYWSGTRGLRSAVRDRIGPMGRSGGIGVRVVRGPGHQPGLFVSPIEQSHAMYDRGHSCHHIAFGGAMR